MSDQPLSAAPTPHRPWSAKTGRFVAIGLSFAAHLAVLVAILSWRAAPSPPVELQPIPVALVGLPLRPEPPSPPKAAPVQSAKAAAPVPAKSARVVRDLPSPIVQPSAPPAPTAELSDAEIAGAATADGGSGAGSGSGGGGCDMAQLVQAALRKDPLVRAAVAGAHRTRAFKVWDGQWVQTGSEDGKGLSAVREAIAWAVGFAPAPCRSEPMHGLVLLSLNEGGGSARLAIGSGAWRWSDLLK